MKYLGLIFLSLAAASPTWAVAACPANPLTTLAGPWTFTIQTAPNLNFQRSYAITGIFNPSVGTDRAGNAIGVLAINATSIVDYSPVRLETDAGRYQINADCSGGTLTFNLSSRPVQYDFWFTADGLSMNIISTSPGIPAIGHATRGPLGCPAGVTNPLSLLSGSYVFSIRSIWFAPLDPLGNSYAIAGRFNASIGADRAGNPIGLLSITATSQFAGPGAGTTSATRLEADAGRFQINSDCSGGTLTFNLSSRPVQFQFYFRADQTTLDLISTTGPLSLGVARQAGPAGCPANPLSVLSGPYTFNVQGNYLADLFINRANPPNQDNYTATGQFVASIGADRAGNPVGRLALNATAVIDTSITRLEGDVGTFQINDDCTGGTLTFNLSSRPQQYDFWFYDNRQSLYMVSSKSGQPFLGSAHAAPTGCPVGLTNTLNLLTGNWIYGVRPVWAVANNIDALTQAGVMTGSIGADRAGNPLGLLAITATSQDAGGSVTRLEGDVGRYTINSDCSGGTLTHNLSSRPKQYQFYFRAGFQTFDAITTSNTGVFSYGVFTR